MKKFLLLLVSILMLSTTIFATESYDTMLITSTYDPTIANGIEMNDSILVQLNGEVIDFTDANGAKVEPQIINNRTMVPMRKIFEVFGANVSWSGETRSITATTEKLEIGLQIDNEIATLKNESGEITEIKLDSAPVIVEGRTLVPVRFIAESLDQKVGWDAYNRVVIIIDPVIIGETIKNNASNFYEYLTTDFEKIETFELATEINGKVKYTDDEERKNYTSLTMVGDLDIKQSDDKIGLDLELNVTGKGILYEVVKEQEYDEIGIKVVADIEDGAIYIKSNLLEENNKWIKYDLGEEVENLKVLIEMAQKQNNSNVDALVNVLLDENKLTVSSYEELQMTLQILTEIMGNDNFKVSGRTTKTYTFNLDLAELLEIEGLNLELNLETKIVNKIAKQSNCIIRLGYEEAEENVEITLELESILKSYNEKVTIKMPKAKEIIEMYE